MEQKELMVTILRILLQKGSVNEEVFDKSLKKANSSSGSDWNN